MRSRASLQPEDKVKTGGKGEAFRFFKEFREIRHRKHPRLEIEIKIGERRFKVLPEDVRRWPEEEGLNVEHLTSNVE